MIVAAPPGSSNLRSALAKRGFSLQWVIDQQFVTELRLDLIRQLDPRQ